jgi:hypothetical protein
LQASIGGVVTFIVALYISKIGVLAFLSRITKNRTQVLGYYACCALVATFGVMSVLIVTVGCSSPSGYYWAFYENSARCDSQVSKNPSLQQYETAILTLPPSQSVRWQVLTALDIITELGLLALPLQLVWGLQMPLTKKTILLVAFYLRLPVIGLSLGRNAYTLRLRHASSDAGLDSAIVTIWLEVQLAYALAASTLSALKAFTESFETGFGLGFTRGKSENGSYALSGMSGSGNGTTTTSHSHSKSPDTHQQNQSHNTSTLETLAYEDTTPHSRPLSPSSKISSTQPLRLRPDLTTPHTTTATATATASATSETGAAPWHVHTHSAGSSSVSSLREDQRSEPLVIMRETELSVRREVAPGHERRSRSAML